MQNGLKLEDALSSFYSFTLEHVLRKIKKNKYLIYADCVNSWRKNTKPSLGSKVFSL